MNVYIEFINHASPNQARVHVFLQLNTQILDEIILFQIHSEFVLFGELKRRFIVIMVLI